MATNRAKKNTAKKRTPRRKAPGNKRRSHWLRNVFALLLLTALLLGGIYYFGSFETRAKMERGALSMIGPARTHAATPAPVAHFLDTLYDAVPSSQGLVVEGGELGRDPESPFVAGVPHSRQAVRPLSQTSYINLFNETKQQAALIALRLDDSAHEEAQAEKAIRIDARMPRLTEQRMTLGQWQPFPLAPPKPLAAQHGQRGATDAQLATNHAPMPKAFADGPWKKAMRELALRYPRRFGEVWIYLGPVYGTGGSNFVSGIPLPEAFYAIAMDLTKQGGLRALALLIPVEAKSKNLNKYLTSVSRIEKLTGLQFLPELDFSVRETLGNYVSPRVW